MDVSCFLLTYCLYDICYYYGTSIVPPKWKYNSCRNLHMRWHLNAIVIPDIYTAECLALPRSQPALRVLALPPHRVTFPCPHNLTSC